MPDPKLTHRQSREHATRINQARTSLEIQRSEIVTDIEETEAVLAAMKRNLKEIDAMLQRGPRDVD